MTIGCSVRPPLFRARIAGTVMRFPGTGEGVARLVAVSSVKVDMGAASNRSFRRQPPQGAGKACQREPGAPRPARRSALLPKPTFFPGVSREVPHAVADDCDDEWHQKVVGASQVPERGDEDQTAELNDDRQE